MGILVASVRGDFVARVTGLDLSKPVGDGDSGLVRNAFDRFAVLVFPEQPLSDEQQIAFSERFGSLEISIRKDRPRTVAPAPLLWTAAPSPSARLSASVFLFGEAEEGEHEGDHHGTEDDPDGAEGREAAHQAEEHGQRRDL